MKPFNRPTVVLLALLAFATSARAEIKTMDVPYKQGDTELQGYVAWDDSVKGKRPGVLVVHEWYGLNDYAKSRAQQLAKMGYVAFAADIYGKGVLAKSPEEAGKLAGTYKGNRPLLRDRVTAGLEALKSQKNVDPKRIAAIGYCFGGTSVLELARSGADIAGIVSFHGALDTPLPAKAAGDIKCKVLVCHGADDPFETDEDLLSFRREMQEAKVDWTMNVYGNSVHGFTNPANKEAKMKGVGYNAEADARSWRDMKNFFDEIFGVTAASAAKVE